MLAFLLPEANLLARQDSGAYELRFRPDLWYNDVDGIRPGVKIAGRVAGTGQEGPHRMDLVVRLGLWFPSLPVSYSLEYTEPLPFFSPPENEFHLRLHSSAGEGYQQHGATLRKRWQPGREYRNYFETGFGYHLRNRFDDNYLLFPQFWSDGRYGMIDAFLEHQHLNRAGIFRFSLFADLHAGDPEFGRFESVLLQQVAIHGSWQLRLRLHGELVTGSPPPEYRPMLSSGAGIHTFKSPMFRARGTVPSAWVRNGYVHYGAGPGLRGYTRGDIASLAGGNPRYFDSIGSINMEFDVPNPIQHAIGKLERVREFFSFRTYLFSAGAVTGADAAQERRFAEAGAGLSLSFNVPDHLGRDRGFVIRYDVPAWLSQPGDESNWKWRHLIGIGAVITF